MSIEKVEAAIKAYAEAAKKDVVKVYDEVVEFVEGKHAEIKPPIRSDNTAPDQAVS